MKTYVYRASRFKSTISFLAFVTKWKSVSSAHQKQSFLAIFFIRECRTHYVGLARTVPSTNTNFLLTLLLILLQESLYEDLLV